jgi:hypothetical protein
MRLFSQPVKLPAELFVKNYCGPCLILLGAFYASFIISMQGKNQNLFCDRFKL